MESDKEILNQERRIFDRFAARFPAKVKDAREDYGANIYLVNASAFGLKLVSRQRLYMHDHVALDVKLPDNDHPLSVNGEVVWSKSREPDVWEIGLKFPSVRLVPISRLYQFAG